MSRFDRVVRRKTKTKTTMMLFGSRSNRKTKEKTENDKRDVPCLQDPRELFMDERNYSLLI